jgi:hypothetical protein
VCHTTEDCSKNPDTYATYVHCGRLYSATDGKERRPARAVSRPPSQPLPLEEDEDNEAESETSDSLNGRLKALSPLLANSCGLNFADSLVTVVFEMVRTQSYG